MINDIDDDGPLFDRGRPPTAEERAHGTFWVLDEKSFEDAVDRALSEIDLTLVVLSLPVLYSEVGFRPYLDAIAHALEIYEARHTTALDRVVEFATALSIARADLEQQVCSLSAWLEISRAVRPEAARYISVPPRFVSSLQTSIAREIPPSAEEIAHSFEFDSLPLA